jgi:RNA polymerase sigma factor (sigma-70 family)
LTEEELILANIEWAEGIARSFHQRLPPSFDVDDMKQLGLMGLMKAAKRYDPAKNDSFRGFARSYVLGECRMGTRRRNWRAAMAEPLDAPEADAAVVRISQEVCSEDEQRAIWRENRRRAILRRRIRRVLMPEDHPIAKAVLVDLEPLEAVAARLGMDPVAVKRRARKLSEKLEGKLGRPPKSFIPAWMLLKRNKKDKL